MGGYLLQFGAVTGFQSDPQPPNPTHIGLLGLWGEVFRKSRNRNPKIF